MCGRYALDVAGGGLASLLDCLPGTAATFDPKWNIAPTMVAPVVVRAAGGPRRLDAARWGIVARPGGVRGPARPLINARSETVFEKPSFRTAASKHRCIVPARAFYEWRRAGRERHPFAIERRDGGLMCFAGILECEEDAPGFVILTTTANPVMSSIHDRMPVLLDETGAAEWLDHDHVHEDPASRFAARLRPASDETLRIRPVAPDVNDVRREGPGLLDPAPTEQGLFGPLGCLDDRDPG
ncbi:MAG: DUF159 family protein [Planctomycetaceae bacterium]|nr:DUF159 family protein [Planctomycetaceae bacterium]